MHLIPDYNSFCQSCVALTRAIGKQKKQKHSLVTDTFSIYSANIWRNNMVLFTKRRTHISIWLSLYILYHDHHDSHQLMPQLFDSRQRILKWKKITIQCLGCQFARFLIFCIIVNKKKQLKISITLQITSLLYIKTKERRDHYYKQHLYANRINT